MGLPDAANDAVRILAINDPHYPAFDDKGHFVFRQQTFDRDRSWLNMMTFGLIDRPKVPPPIKIDAPAGRRHSRAPADPRHRESRTSPGGACSADRDMNSLADDIVAEIEQRRFQLNVNLLKVYNYYRVFVGVALLAHVPAALHRNATRPSAAGDVPVGGAVLHRRSIC